MMGLNLSLRHGHIAVTVYRNAILKQATEKDYHSSTKQGHEQLENLTNCLFQYHD